MPEQVRVLYVGGTGRSGSTVVANALGGLDDAVSVGEVRFLWERGIVQNRLCSCGEPFATCPFWNEVLQVAFGGAVPDAARVHGRITELTQLRRLPALLRPVRAAAPRDLADILTPLYGAIATVSGKHIVVDSSKLPTYAALLAGCPQLSVQVVHLVRDPRAAAFSWQRKKALTDRGTPAFMERRGVAKSAMLWTAWNGALERAWRAEPGYVRLRYETFASQPGPTLDQLAASFELTGADKVVDEQGRLQLPANHTVAGNPSRMSVGPTPVRLDNEWVAAMPRRQMAAVAALTAPLLGHYGYPRAVVSQDPTSL